MDINKEKNKHGNKEEREEIWEKIEDWLCRSGLDEIEFMEYQKDIAIDAYMKYCEGNGKGNEK